MRKKSKTNPKVKNFGLISENPSAKIKAAQGKKQLSLRFFLTNIPMGIGNSKNLKILIPLGKNPSTDGYNTIVTTQTQLTEESMIQWKLMPYQAKSKRPLRKYYAVTHDFMKEAMVSDPFNRTVEWLVQTKLCMEHSVAEALVTEYINANTPKDKTIQSLAEMIDDSQNDQTHEAKNSETIQVKEKELTEHS